jgi:hypothetical protein
MGMGSIALHFASNATYPIVYLLLAGFAAFTIRAPSGETSLPAMVVSLVTYVSTVVIPRLAAFSEVAVETLMNIFLLGLGFLLLLGIVSGIAGFLARKVRRRTMAATVGCESGEPNGTDLDCEPPTDEDRAGSVEDADQVRPPVPKPLPRRHWVWVSLCIAKELEEIRIDWFDSCVQLLQGVFGQDHYAHLDLRTENTELGGEAELAIKAYQLYCTSGFLGQHSYVDPKEGRDFATLVYSQVCGTGLEDCLVYFRRYKDDGVSAAQMRHFSSDVARYIAGDHGMVAGSAVIVTMMESLIDACHGAVAACFGDDETLDQLAKQQKERTEALESDQKEQNGKEQTGEDTSEADS